MQNIYIALFFVVYAILHSLLFTKAFNILEISFLNTEISKTVGIISLLILICSIATTVLALLNNPLWIYTAILSTLLSILVLILIFKNVKILFVLILNIFLLISLVLTYTAIRFKNTYQKDVEIGLERTTNISEEILTKEDIKDLPQAVQRYIEYTNSIGKPKINSMRIEFEGRMRSKTQDWFNFHSVQYNFFDNPTRLFYMEGKMLGLTVPGYHRYVDKTAVMDIRLFGLIPVAQNSGVVMNKAETVTLFNDMCLMAPATLIDKRIEWKEIDSNTVKATFTNQDITISAVLYFDDEGKLIDFTSEDRTDVSDMKQYTFSTPVSEYTNIEGRNILSKGDAVWHYPDGKFTYGEFKLTDIKYNVEKYY